MIHVTVVLSPIETIIPCRRVRASSNGVASHVPPCALPREPQVFRWSRINRSAFGSPHTTNPTEPNDQRIPCNDEASTTTSQSVLGPPSSSCLVRCRRTKPVPRLTYSALQPPLTLSQHFRTFIYCTLDATFDFQQNYVFVLLNLFSGILAFLVAKVNPDVCVLLLTL